jgi:ATP-dependent helicase HepA
MVSQPSFPSRRTIWVKIHRRFRHSSSFEPPLKSMAEKKLQPGQRWISDTEPELGLGTVLSVDNNRGTLLFIATGERRIYALDNAPLTRVRFAPGDRVESADGWSMRVESVEDRDGILAYVGRDANGKERRLEEIELSHFLRFNKPQERLLAGQVDPPTWFRLRIKTQERLTRLEQSPVLGLVGARTSLIPHQLYLAHEVTSRYSPRVLLADEVGLGKTIEAGLIIHRMLLIDRAERILILVPEPLLHQWLVEMLRRFNLRFSLFDEERYWDLPEGGNPFADANLVLCSTAFLLSEPERKRHVVDAGWDLVVIDEAHHLEWSEHYVSPEYALAEELARVSPSLLLLTGTPERLGKQGHFARLRLLDPDRFYDFEQFQKEEQEYAALADVIHDLLDTPRLRPETFAHLCHFLVHDRADVLIGDLNDPEHAAAARESLVQLLLDRHGTGRVLFRNTRATVKGFPKRILHSYPLPLPEKGRLELATASHTPDPHLYPEAASADPEWWRSDPRVRWLADTARRLKHARSKILVICHRRQTAIDLEQALRILAGIRAAVFHEGMTIIARDRAAAWFADQEEGAQILVCSEIGSEGRNFQFAHHLVLFDLPLDPNLLEQRIGRLDRIGQCHAIDIHVPFLAGSAQEILYRWYHEGLDAFRHPAGAAAAVFAEVGEELKQILSEPDAGRADALIQKTKELNLRMQEELHEGRDRLLELNSCRPEIAHKLVEAIRETDGDKTFWPWLETVFDSYGVTVEEHSEGCYILRPGEQLRVPHFPELPEDGLTVTLRRDIALAREEVAFLTWEHPLVLGAIDLVLNSEHGNATIGFTTHSKLAAGQMLIETFHRIDCAAPRRLQLSRYLPTTLIRTLLDHHGRLLKDIPEAELEELPQVFEQEKVRAFLGRQKGNLGKLLSIAENHAARQLPELISAGSARMLDEMRGELQRLAALRRVNPNVRQEELDGIKREALKMQSYLEAAHLRLDAVRLLITI